jgi:hypothetical protein
MARNYGRILRSGLLVFNVTPQIANAGRWLGNTGVHPSKRELGIHRRPVEDSYSNLSVREFSGPNLLLAGLPHASGLMSGLILIDPDDFTIREDVVDG